MQEKKFFVYLKSRLFAIENLDKIPTRQPTSDVATEPEVATEPTKTTKETKVKTKGKTSSLKLLEEFLYKKEFLYKNINEQIFRDYFLYQTPSYLTKALYDRKMMGL